MLNDVQREVAVHVLANALRKVRSLESRERSSGRAGVLTPAFRGGRHACDEHYARGMLDMLAALYGEETATDALQRARALERTSSSR
jgi:hypothetical protein